MGPNIFFTTLFTILWLLNRAVSYFLHMTYIFLIFLPHWKCSLCFYCYSASSLSLSPRSNIITFFSVLICISQMANDIEHLFFHVFWCPFVYFWSYPIDFYVHFLPFLWDYKFQNRSVLLILISGDLGTLNAQQMLIDLNLGVITKYCIAWVNSEMRSSY